MRREVFEALRDALRGDRLVVLATVISGDATGVQVLIEPEGPAWGGPLPAGLEAAVRRGARGSIDAQRSETVTLDVAGREVEVLLEVYPPRPQVVVVGAVHAAIPLVAFARRLGYRTVVVDPRAAFATRERFADADELRVEWPAEAFESVRLDQGTYLALLSHDPKIDLPALEIALRKPVRYVGVLGSRRTHAKRVAALERLGLSHGQIARIHNPIGLDLGGRQAGEIALAVMAEIVAVRHGIGYRPPAPSGD